MLPFYTRFKDLAFKEMRSATVRGDPNLPDGEYGFLEIYCIDPACDCRRVVINVVAPTGPKIWATINYGWESLEFYTKWLHGDKELAREACGVTLDPLNPQTEYSAALLQLFKQVLQDKAYVERLKRHYQLFKAEVRPTPKRQIRSGKKAKRKR